jgi:hypothetical protein
MASDKRRRLERLLRELDAHDGQRCAVVHIPWHTSQADYDTACAMAIAEQSRSPRVAVFLPGKAPTSELWVQWVTTIKKY